MKEMNYKTNEVIKRLIVQSPPSPPTETILLKKYTIRTKKLKDYEEGCWQTVLDIEDKRSIFLLYADITLQSHLRVRN